MELNIAAINILHYNINSLIYITFKNKKFMACYIQLIGTYSMGTTTSWGRTVQVVRAR